MGYKLWRGRGGTSVGVAENAGSTSPFFHPHTPRPGPPEVVVTPGGTRRLKKPKPKDEEHKATQLGTAFNFVNQIVGCGIVGIPYAIRESGLVVGVVLVFFSAYLTRYSLHLLIETARHVDVSTYEALCEAGFGRGGFLAVTVAMFVLAFGSMVSYLMVVRDTLPDLVGISIDDFWAKRALMVACSVVTMFPISSQRDMADLAKTSTLSVTFDIFLVGIVAAVSPIWGRTYDGGRAIDFDDGYGSSARWADNVTVVKWDTVFVGLGVLSFAFVCQHSGFIIAGSLRNPTHARLRRVTASALTLCATLAVTIGVTGYLGFGPETQGNILNCFPDDYWPANVARGLLCTTMLFVYPMESFVARHATVVVLFEGRSAKEGDDHAALARPSRRIALTFALYVMALIPALAFEDLGDVLALTGALGGSAMSYVGPGLCFLGVHGGEFLDAVERRWGRRWGDSSGGGGRVDDGCFVGFFDALAWYALLMPLWCSIAATGKRCLAAFQAEQAIHSPYPSRLGKVVHKKSRTAGEVEVRQLVPPQNVPRRREGGNCEDDYDDDDNVGEARPMLRTGSFPAVSTYATMDEEELQSLGQVLATGRASDGTPTVQVAVSTKVTATTSVNATPSAQGHQSQDDDDDDDKYSDVQDDSPTALDFIVAIGLFLFGVVAATAGVLSIFIGS